MKKCFLSILLITGAITLISWGAVGHRTIAKIAANNLTPKAKEAVKQLLGHTTLPDISNWADEIRNDPNYKYTGAWHFADLPGGLTFEQFAAAVKTMPEDNVYKMVLRCEIDLSTPGTPDSKKVTALKFLVHLIGDLHQPLHVGHPEDKGGNNITVKFFKDDINLHKLWDSGIIDQENMSFEKMAVAYDTASPEQITKWQSDPLMLWIWESYQIAGILYKEAADNPSFDKDYYESHLPVLHNRIEKGGIRLAGVLNKIFDK